MCRILSQSSLQWENNKAYLENTCLWECKNNYIPTYIQNRTLRLHGALDLDYNSISLCSGFMGGLHSLQDSIVIKSCYMSTYYRVIRMERPYSKQLLWQFLPYDHMGFFGAFYQWKAAILWSQIRFLILWKKISSPILRYSIGGTLTKC